MASIEYIQKRIAGKEKEIEKLEKKLARIRVAEAGGWETNNPYLYDDYDLRCCLKDIEAAKKVLDEYKAKLTAETEKAGSRNVKVILDFLNYWKERNMKLYAKAFERYLVEYEEYLRKDKEYCDWHNNGGWRDPNKKEIEKAHYELRQKFTAKWSFLNPYTDRVYDQSEFGYKMIFNTEKLKRDLDQEADRKYDFIIERTNAIVGRITDASNLEIGDKDDLNGYIIGTRGKAKVQTIGAGGYNIQCFHFRTLIHEMK